MTKKSKVPVKMFSWYIELFSVFCGHINLTLISILPPGTRPPSGFLYDMLHTL